MAGIYLGLGSNLGNRRANLALALEMLEPIVRVEAVSPLYESQPQAPAPPPAYLNAACRVVTGLSPLSLLRHCQRIEGLIGRHDTAHWAPRPVDIDLLLFEDEVIETGTLVVPHPRLLERAFVSRPLLDLDAGIVLPGGQKVGEALSRVGSEGIVEVAAIRWHERANVVT